MPATYTHHEFTKDVYNELNVNNKLNDYQDIFNLFGKSFDVLYFVREKLGHFAHKNNVNLYFQNIIKYIRDNELDNDGEVLAYLYGSICHYVLDSTIHPYIFYKSGSYNAKNKNTYKYKGKHNYFEYMIDAIYYQNKNRKTMLKGYRNYRFVMKHIMESRLGIKKFLYKLIDKTKLLKRWELSNTCYHIKELDYSVLNLEHKKWFYPVDKNTNYHYSVYDLYDISILKAKKLIELIEDALNKDDKTINKVLKEIGDLNYSTGKRWDKKYKKREYEY